MVALAGDIYTGVRGIQWTADTFFEPVIYVMGNHEYYHRNAITLLPMARKRAAALGVHLLEQDEWRINGTLFLGCTLWTGFDSAQAP